jgi:hypothetical protein
VDGEPVEQCVHPRDLDPTVAIGMEQTEPIDNPASLATARTEAAATPSPTTIAHTARAS